MKQNRIVIGIFQEILKATPADFESVGLTGDFISKVSKDSIVIDDWAVEKLVQLFNKKCKERGDKFQASPEVANILFKTHRPVNTLSARFTRFVVLLVLNIKGLNIG